MSGNNQNPWGWTTPHSFTLPPFPTFPPINIHYSGYPTIPKKEKSFLENPYFYIAVVIIVLVVLAVIGTIVYCCTRKRNRDARPRDNSTPMNDQLSSVKATTPMMQPPSAPPTYTEATTKS